MVKRIITAAISIPIGIFCVVYPHYNLFGIVWLFLSVLALIEVVQMFSKNSMDKQLIKPNVIAASLGAVYVASAWLGNEHPNDMIFRYIFNIGIFGSILWEFYKAVRFKPKGSVHNLAIGVFAAAYVGWFYSYFMLLRRAPGTIELTPFGTIETGAALVLLLLVSVWSGDSLAYFVGKFAGRIKLAPQISPKKTVEGFIGDLFGSIIAATLMGLWIGIPYYHGIIIGIIVGVGGPIGDLFESIVKRDAGVKDSGDFFPGHGGILDRLDALAFVSPIVFYYLILVGLIVHPTR